MGDGAIARRTSHLGVVGVAHPGFGGQVAGIRMVSVLLERVRPAQAAAGSGVDEAIQVVVVEDLRLRAARLPIVDEQQVSDRILGWRSGSGGCARLGCSRSGGGRRGRRQGGGGGRHLRAGGVAQLAPGLVEDLLVIQCAVDDHAGAAQVVGKQPVQLAVLAHGYPRRPSVVILAGGRT